MSKKERSTNRKRALMKLYDATASIYNRRYRRIQSRKYELMGRMVNKRDFILDVGCGTGLLLFGLSGRGGSLVGLDISRKMVKIAMTTLSREGGRVDLVRADADSLPFRDNIFDKVTSVTVLQNIPEPWITIRDMARVTRVGGEMVLTSLRKKYDLPNLKRIISSTVPDSRITSEWDSDEEDVGVTVTKLI